MFSRSLLRSRTVALHFTSPTPLLPRSTSIGLTNIKIANPVLFSTRFYTNTTIKMAQEFKLKGLSSLSLKDGDKVEAEVEGIEKGKVVLVKVKGEVHALNANCTHFGAPLKNGVLTEDGRLTCPWHGGRLAFCCFYIVVMWSNLLMCGSVFQCQDWRCGRCPGTAFVE
jgi:nitrite reductase/ring-hydroxylating ferredoxin subunit